LGELLALRFKNRLIQALLDCGITVNLSSAGGGQRFDFGELLQGRMGRREAAATLGLRAGASKEQIKEAYRRLSLKYHPDKEGGSQEKQVRLNEAKEVLMKGLEMG
jgi:DnaJ-domain-containing protein 1